MPAEVDQVFLHVSRKGIKNERNRPRAKSQHHKERTLVMAGTIPSTLPAPSFSRVAAVDASASVRRNIKATTAVLK